LDLRNQFDDSIILAMNSLVGKWKEFDAGVEFLDSNYLIKGAVLVSVYWWFWFRSGDAATVRRTREHVTCSFAAGMCAVLVARILAVSLPFRLRPRFEQYLQFRVPPEQYPTYMWDWSAFPSDHAALFAGLAIGVGFISHRLGALAFVYFLVAVAFPRVYLGFHHPTDVLAGVLIGGVLCYVFNRDGIREVVAAPALRWERVASSSFYVALFILSFEVATLFDSVHSVAVAAAHFVRRAIAG
jgi:undecaprenyl-diphosphatase